MILRKLFFLIFLGLVATTSGQTVKATVNTNHIAKGEVFTLTVQADDSDDDPVVDVSPLQRNFTLISGPASSTNISWINGKMTSTKSISWTFSPNRTGRLSVPALNVRLGRKNYKTRPIQITVSAGPKQPGNRAQDLFLQADVDKREAVVGEQITVTYKLYTRVNLQIEQLQFPDFVGFWTEDLFVPKTADFRDAAIQGVAYKVATLYTVALFPTKSGSISLPSMTVRCSVPVKKKRRRNSGIWDDPFFNSFDPFGQQRTTKVLRTDPLTIDVQPYPSGQPANFTGAVGSFQVRTSVDTTALNVNDGVTFRVLLTGSGNLPLISAPTITFPPNMEVYPPTTEIKKDPFRDRISGSIKWEYILIPREAGKLQLPRIEVPYFDLQTSSWKKATAKPIVLTVYPGDEMTSVKGDFTKREITLLGKDIRYIHTGNPRWITRGKGSIPGRVVTLYILALALWVSPIVIRRSQVKSEATRYSRLARKALKTALKKLDHITGSPFEEIPPIVYTYIMERFGHHTDKLDPLTVRQLFESKSSPVVDQLVERLKICDAGKYSPEAMNVQGTIVDEVKSLLRAIDALDK
ncbi:MAG: protein BatD [FCB group bacterium]|nr:protein BatD [FCB group bacterium]